ncbi:MAG: type II toxin-antitoxin system HicA family toxin [Thermoproteota archaeon]
MVKLLSKQGFQIVRQKGDHVSLFKKVDNEPPLHTLLKQAPSLNPSSSA